MIQRGQHFGLSADLVLMQRQPVSQAQLAGRIWRLPPPLTALKEDQVVALGRNLWPPLRLITPREKAILGLVRRGD